MTVYSHPIRQIEQEAYNTLKKLGNGQFGSKGDQGAMELVQYRKGLLKALEILRATDMEK